MGPAYAVRLERGEQLVESLTGFLDERGIGAGSLVGIGALKDVELGYYELERQTYHRKTFREDHELVNLTGNVSVKDGKPFLHAHVTISGPDFQAHAGHLFRAVVAVTVELVVTPLEGRIGREVDKGVGLALWSFKACPG